MNILIEWLGILGRWAHVLFAITWIGTSFYFNWLDLSERKPKAPTLKPNVEGEVHEMHGGSFYYHERFWPTGDNPRTLAHSGPAQFTFLTGLFLVVYFYWRGPSVYLIPPGSALTVIEAVLLSGLSLLLPWLAYHQICKRVQSDTAVLCVMAVVVTLASFVLTRVFNPPAAFVHVGAMLGTIMAANVQYVIIPNHIRMRRQVQAGETVDLTFHKLAKRRSQHNNYMTLPVLFGMLSAHFPLATSSELSWAILVLVMAALFTLRHYRNVQLRTDRKPRALLWLAIALLACGIGLSFKPRTAAVEDRSALSTADARIHEIVQTRCTVCHATTPSFEGFTVAPNGVHLETMAEIEVRKDQIMTLAIASDLMPPGNLTEMTDAERRELADWLAAKGAVALEQE
jgi:uncharacterized membrane protein